MSFLLLRQIAQLFMFIFLGWLLVRVGLLKTSDSKILSVIVLYLVTPCVIIDSFQVEFDQALLQGIALSLAAAVLIHLVLIFGTKALVKPLKLTAVERASVIYPNAASIIIPIVTAILGKEWVLFSAPFLLVQHGFLWSHCCALISGETKFNPKKILLNVNIIAIIVGVSLFLLRLPLPGLVREAMDSLGGVMGPLNMIVTGMLMAGVDLKATLRSGGVWKTAALRLAVFPLIAICLLKFTGMAGLAPNGETILMVSLLTTCAPAAVAVTQISQVYSDEGRYASFINVVTTLLCIITMPLIIGLYQIL